MAMDPAAAVVVVVSNQADVGGSLMASGTRAFAHAKRSQRRTVRPVLSHPRSGGSSSSSGGGGGGSVSSQGFSSGGSGGGDGGGRTAQPR